MSHNVFANGREVSAKTNDNKSLCAMPDVCLSPPSPPAGPVPIPYPNTAMASDTSDGTKTVMVGGDEAGLKDSSNYKKSTGDEPATKSLGMGVVSHTIQDKMRHAAWSFDVMFEGQNVIRHLDITTHNHMNTQNSGCMTVDQAAEAVARGEKLDCKDLSEANADAREKLKADLPDNHTVTMSYRVDASEKPKFMMACSNKKATDGVAGWQPAVEEKSMPPCAHGRKTGKNQRNHAENKTLDPEMRAGGGGTILMSTVHVNNGVPDMMPCGSCKKAICESHDCGIEVTLCNKDHNQVPAAEMCDGATPKGGPGDSDPFWISKGFGPLAPAS
jgi:hypothetical protein